MKKEHFEILLEDIKEKVDLILEGHASLDKKIDRVYENLDEKVHLNSLKIDAVNARLDRVEGKVDKVAEDLAAHRADTESHPRGYKASDKASNKG